MLYFYGVNLLFDKITKVKLKEYYVYRIFFNIFLWNLLGYLIIYYDVCARLTQIIIL